MAGAEGERGLDLDADAVRRDAGAVVRAVHDEAAGRDRLEPGEALAATQSFAAMRSKRSAPAAAAPAALPPDSRTLAASTAQRK